MRRFSKKCLAILAAIIGTGTYWLYPDTYPTYPESDHYSAQNGQFFNWIKDGEKGGGKIMDTLYQMIFQGEKFAPNSPLPMVKPDWQAFLASNEQAKFVWFGHSSLLARMDGKTLFIDPVFVQSASPLPIMMHRFQPPPASLEELPSVDVIVYSHNHYDHFDETVLRHYVSQKTHFIVPLGMAVLLKKAGVSEERITSLDWWQSVTLGNIEISATPARHNTGRGFFDRNKTLWAGYVFKTPTEQFYYSGDTSWGDGSHFRQIAERFGGFDLAFIENGQYSERWIDSHMLPEQTAEAVKAVKTTRFMPVHWAAYPLALHTWDEPVRLSVPLVEQAGIQIVSPLMGEVFDKNSPTTQWWQTIK